MSASRKKKERQDAPGQGLTQKQLKEQQEAQAQKRKTILYSVIGAVVAILVVALLVWHSGFFQSRTVAATVNGRTYHPTDVSYYYHAALNQDYMMAQYGFGSFDASVDPKEQYVDAEQTTSYYDKFMQSAMDSLTTLSARLDQAQKEGFSDDAAVKAYVDDQLKSLDASLPNNYTRATYLRAVYGRLMTVSRFKDCLEREGLAQAYVQSHQDSLTYDDAALEGYYTENKDDLDTYEFSVCFINGAAENPVDENGDPVKDEEGNTVTATDEEKDAAMDAAEAKAEDLLDELKDGGDFEKLAGALTSDSEKNSFEAAKRSVGSSLPSAYKSWLADASRKNGDLELFHVDGTGSYVVRFEGRERDESPTVDVRHILIQAETTDADETDENGYKIPSQAALDAAKEKAQKLLDQWKAGDATAESFGKLAEENSTDSGSNTNGGLYENIPENQFFAAFNDWMYDSARQPGDTDLIENPQSGQQGWHVVYYVGPGEPVWKSTSDDALRSADMSDWQTSIKEGYTAEQNDGIRFVTSIK